MVEARLSQSLDTHKQNPILHCEHDYVTVELEQLGDISAQTSDIGFEAAALADLLKAKAKTIDELDELYPHFRLMILYLEKLEDKICSISQDMLDLKKTNFTTENSSIPPYIKQYHDCQKDYPDSLIFFRMGDFYELFYSDAITVSRELKITLTERHRTGTTPIQMCGIPLHSSEGYFSELLDRNYKIAICEYSDKHKRMISRLLSPGTTTNASDTPF